MSAPTGLRATVSRRQKKLAAQQPATRRRRPIFECLLAVTWGVQSDYFGTRDGVTQTRSLRTPHFEKELRMHLPNRIVSPARRSSKAKQLLAARRQRQSKRLGMEVLEFRAMLATLWVDNTPMIGGPGMDTFTVSGGTHVNQGGLTSGVDLFTTIGAAVTAASNGDTINVSDGTYAENVVLNKEVKLLGAQANVAATGVARAGGETTLAGTGTSSSFVLTVQADNVTVNGLEITPRLFARDGINVLTGSVAKPGDPTIGGYRTNIDLVNNWIHSDAGPINQRNGVVFGEHTSNALQNFNGQIEDVQITGNYIDIPTLNSSSAASGRAIIFTNQFRDSSPVTPPYSGPTIKFTDFTIDGNTIAGSSSGINATAAPATFKFESPVITGNTFQNSSTGFNSGNLYNADFSENTFQNNRLNAIVGLIGGSLSRNTFGSSVTGDNYALQLWGPEFNYPVGSENFTIENNFFTYGGFASGSVNASGILLRTGVLSDTITIRDNSFTNLGLNASANAIVNNGLGTANASGNWWGTTSETAIDALMSGPVDFTPFLYSGTDTSGATGFQGDFSTPVDFGDAPDSYGTLLASDGARHLVTGPTLGATRDFEADGQPSVLADGDGADEDGVTMSSTLYARVGATITVNAPTGGRLDAWIDYNRNGVFDANEQIANGLVMLNGDTTFSIEVPKGIVAGPSYARFRVSSSGGLGPTGPAANGEVEDHAITLAVPTPGSAVVVDDPLFPGQGVLILQGTDYFYETITVQPTSGQPGKVTASVSTGATVAGIDLASFGRILIFGEGGIDSITVANSITKPATIYGDVGFDTINGGGGDDTIIGGADYDSLNGNGGYDTFIAGSGFDSVNGGAGFDSLHKTGSGTFNMSNYALTNGSDYVSHSGLEEAVLTGGANADTFSFAGWTGKAFAFGGGGSNTLVDSADANYVLGPSSLTRTIGATTSEVVFLDIQNVSLTGGFGNNTFNLSAWTGTAVVNGGYFGTDTVILAGDVNYNLTDAILQRPSFGMVRLSGIENAVITGGGSANTFNITNWSNAATLNGEGGNDKVVAAGNVNFTLSDTSLTRSTGGAITLSSIQEAEILGGAGNNVINGAAFTGTIKFDGAGGNDTLTSGSGPAILLGGAGNDTLTAGSGRAFMIGGLGLDRITGGSNSDLIIDGRTTSDDNAAALAHILADWISAQTYDQRADHVIADHLGTTNVIHDDSIDILLGGGDDDLFFAKLDAPFLDSIGDKVGIERAI